VTLEPGAAIQAGDPQAAQTDVFWITGRKGLEMSPNETAALKAWLTGGGYVVADACMGERQFDAAFQTLAKDLGLEVRTLPRDDGIVKGKPVGWSGYPLDEKVDFTPSLRTDRVGSFHAELRGLYLGDKLVGLYSPFDVLLSLTGVRAYGNRGYAAADARAVATNMLLPATTMAARAGAPDQPAAPGGGAPPTAAPGPDPAETPASGAASPQGKSVR
jgi:hypothetical protein